MTTPENERKEQIRRRDEVIKARSNSRSEEEKEAMRAKIFGDSFGKGGPIRHSKSLETVIVPEGLRDFMVDVLQRTKEGDESARIPSGDFLQYERAYGGLDKTGDHYSFVYFGEEGHSILWEFRRRPEEIERVADGRIDQLNVQRFERL